VGDIDKTISESETVTVTLNIKWQLADSEPAAPTDYIRYADLDIDLGQLGKLWAFKKTTP